jgi:hypothetical protein
MVPTYLARFARDDRYAPADEAVTKLFHTFPQNSLFEDVLLKVTVLNDLYSTNILATFAVAKHICSLDVDTLLRNRSPHAVDQIARIHLNSKPRNNYSFATKYCSWHFPNDYPIYDGYVGGLLSRYRKRDGFARFVTADLKQYARYKKILVAFQQYYKLEAFGFKQLDKFLWMYGKSVAGV